MEVSFSGRDIGDSAAFQPVVQEFTTNEQRAGAGSCVELELVEKTGFRSGGCGGCLGCGECVEDVGRE